MLVDGAPLAGGTIVLTPIGGGRSAAGEIQADGSFVLETESSEGASIGEHRVIVLGKQSDDEEVGRISYTPPGSYTLLVEADQQNNFEIDIRRASGWTPQQDD